MAAPRFLSAKTRRDLTRALHLAITLPLGALIYAPPALALELRPALQIVLFPLLGASGLWMWQGYRVTRWWRGGSRQPAAAPR